MKYTKKLSPKTVNNNLYHFLGALLIVANKLRHMLSGYKTPRTFSSSQISRSIDYEIKIVKRWITYLSNYTGDKMPLKDKVVLELGVGPDLGTGLLLLAMGARKYYALDVHNLASTAPYIFYERLLQRIKKEFDCDVHFLEDQIRKYLKGEDCQLCYVVDKDFRISEIHAEVDVTITQVAFEHFDDVNKTIREISNKMKNGGLLYSHVDMNTHTRWIKDKDPMNIYRYSDLFWNMFKFKGSPNRVRIPQYVNQLNKNNFSDIAVEPRTIVDDKYAEKVLPVLDSKFRDLGLSEMRIMSFVLMSKKD